MSLAQVKDTINMIQKGTKQLKQQLELYKNMKLPPDDAFLSTMTTFCSTAESSLNVVNDRYKKAIAELESIAILFAEDKNVLTQVKLFFSIIHNYRNLKSSLKNWMRFSLNLRIQ